MGPNTENISIRSLVTKSVLILINILTLLWFSYRFTFDSRTECKTEQMTGGLGKAYNHVTSRADDEVHETEQYAYVGVAVDDVSACY